ncbi:MAG: EAL domain-containing protein [Roseburia inulinivorans]
MKNAILIVDDSRLNRETLADILKDKYNIIEAEDGRSGLEVLEKRKDDIVLVILDIVMPGMDGFAFMEEARTRESIRNIPIVVATTENDYQTEKRCLELGVWDFIPKVFQPEIIRFRVLNTIKRSMAHSLEHDGLTGLYTIQKFSQCVKRNLENNQDTKFTFIRLDIERFKMINNFYGVEAGDRLLVYISGLIETYWQDVENCVFGRIDGDVFGICFPKDEKKLNGFILYIKRELKKYKAAYYLETAMGIYDILDNNLDVRNIIARATLATKAVQRLQYMIHEARYTEELRAKIIREQNIINEMEHALETGEFVVYFQPKYELDHCRPSGAEALVRWKKADGTIVSPGDFIPVFESNGFIIRLDYYVWDQVCQFIKNNLAHRGDSEVISVNVSRVNLYNPDFLESLVNLVEKYKIPPKYLNLELTESAFSDDARMIQNAVDYLHKAGFTILMDDFGSGYSSLNVLKDIDIDVLKIDMRFLSKGSSEERGEKILEAVIKMAKSLDMLVIAEGVEEEKQVKMLKRLGCDYIQGYYFAKPMPKKDYREASAKEPIEKGLHKIKNVRSCIFFIFLHRI